MEVDAPRSWPRVAALDRTASKRIGIHTALLAGVVFIGIVGRVAFVDRPLDQRMLAPWREADYTQIARNFYRDGLNILYPKIDWRGDTPGYVESEFPLIPWLGALSYRLIGYHEALLRIPSAVFGCASLLLFVMLSRRALPQGPALFASAAFAINPLLIYLGSAIQPDPLMLCLSLVAMTLIWRWEDSPSFSTLLAAAAAIAAAILAKSPAILLGLVLAYGLLRKLRFQVFTDGRIYAAGLVAVLPPLAWYWWAAHFWWNYGNSLGVSNESHFIGLDMLVPPRFLFGLLKWETIGVFTPAGWLLAVAALRAPRRAERALVWYGAVCIFYVITARTSADNWSFYYHCIAVPPACLLMGAGVDAFGRGEVLPGSLGWAAGRERWVGRILAAATIGTLVAATGILIHRRDTRTDYEEMRNCALQFVPYVAATEQIVVHGGAMFDEYGHPVAHNESMIFAWMDRKGFNYGTEEFSIQTLDRIAARGGRYWIVQPDEVHLKAIADQHYRRVAECGSGYFLYDLRSSN